VTDLQNTLSLNERDHAQDPVFPAVEGNRRGNKVVGKRKLVVKQTEK
jgi:hypothetical protein